MEVVVFTRKDCEIGAKLEDYIADEGFAYSLVDLDDVSNPEITKMNVNGIYVREGAALRINCCYVVQNLFSEDGDYLSDSVRTLLDVAWDGDDAPSLPEGTQQMKFECYSCGADLSRALPILIVKHLEASRIGFILEKTQVMENICFCDSGCLCEALKAFEDDHDMEENV